MKKSLKNLENLTTLDNKDIINTSLTQDEILDTLEDYPKWKHIKIPFEDWVLDDFVITNFNSKDWMFTVEKKDSNWSITIKISRDLLDYYNKNNFTKWDEILIKIKWNYLKSKVVDIDEKNDKILIERMGQEGKEKKWFTRKKLNKYNNYVHVIGTNEYLINGKNYKI